MEMTKVASTRRAAMSENVSMGRLAGNHSMNPAPKMQRSLSMKSILVGFLAVAALSGCGVGMDDPEGQQAATGQTTAQLMGTNSDNTASAQAEMRGPQGQDPRTMLPQDPIPVLVGSPLPAGTPRPGK